FDDRNGGRDVGYPGDPSPGWTFLRKLIQLPIALPTVSDDSVDRLLDHKLGPVEAPQPAEPSTSGGVGPASGARTSPEGRGGGPASGGRTGGEGSGGGTGGRGEPGAGASAVETDLALSQQPPAPSRLGTASIISVEREPAVRHRLRERLTHQTDRSARHAKRL